MTKAYVKIDVSISNEFYSVTDPWVQGQLLWNSSLINLNGSGSGFGDNFDWTFIGNEHVDITDPVSTNVDIVIRTLQGLNSDFLTVFPDSLVVYNIETLENGNQFQVAQFDIVDFSVGTPSGSLLGPKRAMPEPFPFPDAFYHDYFWWKTDFDAFSLSVTGFNKSDDGGLIIDDSKELVDGAFEGNSDEPSDDNYLRFLIELSEPAEETILVDYAAVSDGDEAINGLDFISTSGTATFTPGNTLVQIDVPIVGDFEPEDNQAVRLSLSNARSNGDSRIQIEDDSFELLIKNDDPGLSLQFDQSSLELIEGEPAPKLVFNLEKPVDFDLTVSASLPGGSGSDQLALSSGTIPAGELQASLDLIQPLKDEILEATMSGFVELEVEGNGGPVQFEVSNNISEKHEIEVVLQDRVFAGLAQDEVDRGAKAFQAVISFSSQAIGLAFEKRKVIDDSEEIFGSFVDRLIADPDLVDDLGISNAIRNDLLDRTKKLIGDLGKGLNLAIDGAEIVANFEVAIEAAERKTDLRERSDALHDAYKGLTVDIADKVLEAAFLQSATIGAGYAAGYIATAVTIPVASIPALVGLGGVVLFGLAGSIVYDSLLKQAVRNGVDRLFSDQFTKKEFFQFIQQEQKTPGLNQTSLSPGDDVVVASGDLEAFAVELGDDDVQGSSQTLNGDVMLGFGSGDSITFLGERFGVSAVRLSAGSTVLEIDADEDGNPDATITLAGDDAPKTIYLSNENENTVLRADAIGAPISIGDDIVPGNTTPIAVDDNFATYADVPLTRLSVLLNDIDSDGDSLSASVFDTNATLGLVLENGDGTFSYDPNKAFDALADGEQAEDSFTYRASDGQGLSAPATVTITIDGRNDAPVARDDDTGLVATAETPVTIDVLSNDSDVDAGDNIEVVSVQSSQFGSTEIVDGKILFSPNSGVSGEVSFEYTISDGDLTSTATAFIFVGADVLDPPVTLLGTKDRDQLVGGSGDDKILLRFDDDIGTGGRGADTFLVDSRMIKPGDVYTITDFNSSEGDTIKFRFFDQRREIKSDEDLLFYIDNDFATVLAENGSEKTIAFQNFDMNFGSEAQTFIGSSRSDFFDGGNGQDVFMLRSGNDTAIGGSDSDTFIFDGRYAGEESFHTIGDLNFAEGDALNLRFWNESHRKVSVRTEEELDALGSLSWAEVTESSRGTIVTLTNELNETLTFELL